MSADGYAVCPKCTMGGTDIHALKKQMLLDYGKIPQAEYEKLSNKVKNAESAWRESSKNPMLAENYEFYYVEGADGPVLVASYSAVCRKCGLTVEFEAKKTIDLDLKGGK